jgi:drug/metabolite transporter (DMT)-like permease
MAGARRDFMPGTVVLIVLLGALLHASWNAVVKSSGDKLLNIVMVVTVAGVAAAAALPFFAQPMQASWPYLAASAVLQVVYIVLVSKAYKHGDMSLAYPLMRGTAPLIVALASGPLIGESLPALRWLGVLLVSSGVIAMALESRQRGEGAGRTAAVALLNACFIAAYTVTDGIGVRLSGAPIAYTLWIFTVHGAALLLWAMVRQPLLFGAHLRKRFGTAVFGAFATLASYGSALWAMSLNVPVASVSALRETSIIFAAALSVILFGERLGGWRWAGIALICCGVAVIRIA